ncbi:hypothetical protein GLW04_12650, partial [Halobacillus litoralis]
SNIIFGVNMSFADIFLVFLLCYLILQKKLIIPLFPLLAFFLISILVLVTSVFFVPAYLDVNTNVSQNIKGYLKIMALFLFFVMGYNLTKLQLLPLVVKTYSFFAVFIGLIGILFYAFNISMWSNILFYAGTRYTGLMNDPNYFAILQLTALVYFIRKKDVWQPIRFVSIIILILGVIVSSSKTGMLVLGIYGGFRGLIYLINSIKTKKRVTYALSLFIIIFLSMLNLNEIIDVILKYIVDYIPTFARVENLFRDFDGAITEGGSGRGEAWETALKLVALSPFLGIGLGNYTLLGSQFYNVESIAHNTYLQFLVEYGIPVTFSFYFFILFLVMKVLKFNNENVILTQILLDILFVLMLGSFAISLNNARIFWIILGSLFYFLSLKVKNK